MLIEDFGSGIYNFNAIDIIGGVARFRGVEYDGRTNSTSK